MGEGSSLLPEKPTSKVWTGTHTCCQHQCREVGKSTGSAGRSQTAPADPAASEVACTPAPCLGSLEGGPGLCVPMSSRPAPAGMPTGRMPAWVGTEALGRAVERMGEGSGSWQAHRAEKRAGGWGPGTRLLLGKPSEAGRPGSCSGALFRSWKQLLKFSFGDSGQSHFSF